MEDASENLTVEVPVTETGPDAPAATASPKRYAGEFDTVEELEAKYQELLKTTTTAAPSGELPGDGEGGDPNSDGDPEGGSPTDKEKESASTSRDDAEKELSGKGLDISEFEQEFDATGGLSEESYAKLEQAGLGKAVVDSYIAGRTALLEGFISDVKGLAGGEDGYRAITEWADKGGLTDAEKESYNRVMNSGDKALIKLAVSGLVAKYREEEGSTPELVTGKATASRRTASDTFESTEQVVAAMKDPRYGKDPAYTRAVERKVARSRVFGG
ncbi:capsid assembly protein [Bilophila wadsworthia]|jgi:hypothetical protein|uniref:capsid assembly protein n=1 Tax=Bilophila wadsworthia TaxID=35833 RepID=UPI00307C1586